MKLRPQARFLFAALFAIFLGGATLPQPLRANGLTVPPEATAGLDLLYAGDPEAAIAEFQKIRQNQPEHPLGYMLEAEARWWKIYCSSAEFKWGMTDAWHRGKLKDDQPYFDLARKTTMSAEAQLKKEETAEMRFYAGMGHALAARLHSLRGENRASARAGVRAREELLRALALDPELADADLGLGLYDYYVDTLSTIARILRFFMGIPGGSKRDGVKQLERAMTEGVLSRVEARFYLAKNLRNYDRDYERALSVLEPLVAQYPSNPMFQLLRGDLYAKLNRKGQAAECFRAAAASSVPDPQCTGHIHELAESSLAAEQTHR